MLTEKQLSYLQNRLIKEQTAYTQQLQNIRQQGLEKSMTDELSSYGNHPADLGSELFEREKDFALLEHVEKQWRDSNEALLAIQNKTYGTCKVCKKTIPYERLNVLPTAMTCITHSPTTVVPTDRPVEEDLLNPPFHHFYMDKEDATMFDAEDCWQSVERYGTSDSPSDMMGQEETNYTNMYSDETIGFSEPIENFLMADIYGKYIGNAANSTHEEYEQTLDQENLL